MKNKGILVGIAIIFIIALVGCKPKDSKSVVSDDVSAESQEQERETKKSIELATNYLNEGKYDKAKEEYEKIIAQNIFNAEIYKEIEKIYMDKGRYDDAYYIISMAVANNVDVENMNKILDEIKSKFPVITLNNSIYVGNQFSLPTSVSFDVNGETVEKEVKWQNNYVNTSISGTYTYEGTVEAYGRSVQQVLVINEKPVDKYVNEELGFSMIFPDNWSGKYELRAETEHIQSYLTNTEEAIREVIVLYKGVNGYGQIFRIVEQNPGDENLINPVDGALSYFIAKDKPYVVGTPTGLGYDESATDFEEYMKLYNEAKDVINSIEVLQ